MTYKDVRRDLVHAVIAEMMGPGSEDPYNQYTEDVERELISEDPLQRYTVGMLYEQEVKQGEDDEDTVDSELAPDIATGDPSFDALLDMATTTANQYFPSSIAMSFYTSGINPALLVDVRWGQYRRLDPLECYVPFEAVPPAAQNNPLVEDYLRYSDGRLVLLDRISVDIRDELVQLGSDSREWKHAIHRLFNLSREGWKRIPRHESVQIQSVSTVSVTREQIDIDDGLALICVRRPNASEDCTLFTLALVNTYKSTSTKKAERTFFQAGFTVRPKDSYVRFLDYRSPQDLTEDPEQLSMALLYRNKKVFAVGHGCAVAWDRGGTVLRTDIMPVHEVPGVVFDVEELEPVSHILDMGSLSDIGDLTRSELVDSLRRFVSIYGNWIDRERARVATLEIEHRATAYRHLEACRAAAERMERGLEVLEDDNVFRAFQWANRAMLMQRHHTMMQATKRYPDDASIAWPNDYRDAAAVSWRPFQLAFLLMNLEGIVNPASQDRHIVDLIWFPTGGGKTEAYLGLGAFCIFLRRLLSRERGGGTAILMRYTLRLLTAQQFQRASTLICACELIRREREDLLGQEPISLGLWLGSDNTPTTVAEAQHSLDSLMSGIGTENMFHVLSCPWCGTRLTRDLGSDRGEWGYRIDRNPKRFVIHCTEPSCPFHDALPVRIVDEDIYRVPPTLLFATVDKFALMPWKAEVGSIFGLHSDVESPSLIIQDELHLISGPLGTIVGLYETAVDELCSFKGTRPKIVASTATIRSAGEQVRALYARQVHVFPPPGLDAEDSFFSREASLDERPGRQYLGIMATGRTLTSTQVRLVASILQSVLELQCPDELKDPYWTLVSYFNTIRELGRTSTLALDDIKDHIRRTALRHGTRIREYYQPYELTGSRKSADIPRMLEMLNKSYPADNPIDLLHTSNMMSVGIDIDRLGLMEMVSQPKSTAEYIQATSRVGRKYPGLVITLFDGARARDRSHYEQFLAYHQALYRYVEPTSVTPFSGPSRDRALRAVFVTLVRHTLGLVRDSDAANFSWDLSDLDAVMQRIIDRVQIVMDSEASATADTLQEYIREWDMIAELNDSLTYANGRKPHLLYPAGRNDRYWPTMQSMRNVDAPGNLLVID